jgi:methionyl-tRNA formyltransferase
MKILFYGTPDFAVASLKALVDAGKNVIGVVTAPDRPAGRGYQLKQSAVKEFALANSIPVFQPTNLKSEDFNARLEQLNPDLQIVVAFRMLPEVVWSFPVNGTFNLHGSLLPKYRGAAPINWAIINGDKETGVTSFFLQHKIDTGNIILQKSIVIEENETAGLLHDRLMTLGAEVVINTVKTIESKNIITLTQEELVSKGIDPTPAPKLTKQTCVLDVNESVTNLHNKLRGLSPFPGAFIWIERNGKKSVFKWYQSKIESTIESDSTAKFIIEDNQLKFQNNSGVLNLLEVQLEGKKRMNASVFIQGFKIDEWSIVKQ